MVSEIRSADTPVDTQRAAEQSRNSSEAQRQRDVEEQAKARQQNDDNQRSADVSASNVSISSDQPVANPQADRVEQSDAVTRAQLNGTEPKSVERPADSGEIERAELASQDAQNQIQERSEEALKAQANQRPEVVLELLN